MKKVIILSYFFPPSSLTSSQRVYSWASQLHDHGYYPIVITRNWDKQGSSEISRLINSGDSLSVEKKEHFEVHYLPYKSSKRDQLLIKNKRYLAKILTYFNLIFKNFFQKSIAFNNLFVYADQFLSNNKDIELLITSGNPFEQFHFGYLLKKKHPSLNWVADYRDEWTSNFMYNKTRGRTPLIRLLEKQSEKKWLSNSSLVITTCSYFSQRISNTIKKEVKIVPHGINKIHNITEPPRSDKFVLLYSGTLYSNQILKPFIEAFNSFSSNKKDVQLVFLGTNTTQEGLQTLFPFLNRNIISTEWVEREEAIKWQTSASAFLLLPYSNMKGWPSSKLYEYLGYKKPIILYPSDQDVMESVLVKSTLGIIPKTSSQMEHELKLLYNNWKQGKTPICDDKQLAPFTRKNQTKILAQFLDEI